MDQNFSFFFFLVNISKVLDDSHFPNIRHSYLLPATWEPFLEVWHEGRFPSAHDFEQEDGIMVLYLPTLFWILLSWFPPYIFTCFVFYTYWLGTYFPIADLYFGSDTGPLHHLDFVISIDWFLYW